MLRDVHVTEWLTLTYIYQEAVSVTRNEVVYFSKEKEQITVRFLLCDPLRAHCVDAQLKQTDEWILSSSLP